SLVGLYEILADDQLVLPFLVLQPVEGSFVGFPDELGSAKGLYDIPACVVIVAEHCRCSAERENYCFIARGFLAQLDVLERRTHRQRHIGDQRPRRRGPDENAAACFRPRIAEQVEGDEGARILDVLVALRDFVAREAGAASRAVGENLVAAIEPAATKERCKRPPHALDVIVRVSDVRIAVVEPVPDPFAQLLPIGSVAPDALAAHLVEPLDTDLLDLLLRRSN